MSHGHHQQYDDTLDDQQAAMGRTAQDRAATADPARARSGRDAQQIAMGAAAQSGLGRGVEESPAA